MMATKLVKCSNCNVVISEVLAFIPNKIEVMDEDSISRICITSFTVATSRKITRKGGGKVQRNIEDIICLFKETDPDLTPIFVARNLNKLPPVTFDYLDASKLLKDILILRDDISYLKKSYATLDNLAEIKNDLENLKAASIVYNFEDTVNRKRGAHLLNEAVIDSGPIGFLSHCVSQDNQSCKPVSITNQYKNPLQTLPADSICERNNVTVSTTSDTEAAAKGESAECVTSPVMLHETGSSCAARVQRNSAAQRALSPQSRTIITSNAENATLTTTECSQIEHKKNDWTTVQKKRKQHFAGKMGCANHVQSFKAAENKVPIFISNVHKDTDKRDIVDYINEKTDVIVSLIKLKQKKEKGHYAFKLFVPKFKLHMLLDEKLWLEGILFRRFINFKDIRAHSEEAHLHLHLQQHNGQ